jgi:hypothetical protein
VLVKCLLVLINMHGENNIKYKIFRFIYYRTFRLKFSYSRPAFESE